jgi:hypothetical protein
MQPRGSNPHRGTVLAGVPLSEAPTPFIKPIACIKRYGSSTLCGRSAPEREFLFTDGEYAAAHYDPKGNKLLPTQLSACEACCDVVRANRGEASSSDYGGAALRKSM